MRIGSRWDQLILTERENAFLRDYCDTDVSLTDLKAKHRISGTMASYIISHSPEGIAAQSRRRRKSVRDRKAKRKTTLKTYKEINAKLDQLIEQMKERDV